MLRCSILLLLLCLLNHSETPSVGARSVEEKKGGNITLKCELKNNTIIHLYRRGQRILDCQYGTCENTTENVQGICKEGVCDIIIKNLSFSDAGKYILRFSHTNDPTEKVQENKTYQLQIQDEVCVNIGEKLKLDVLSNADKVEHQNKTSSEWTMVWNRSHGVQSERLTDTDGNLSINNVSASDAGSYGVLEYNVSKAVILITVNVTECKTESKAGLEQHEKWIVPVCTILLLAVIVIVIIFLIRWCWHRDQCRGYIQVRVQENPDPQNL